MKTAFSRNRIALLLAIGLSSLSFSSATALAEGHEAGNGGGAVFCNEGEPGAWAMAYDEYLAKIKGLHPAFSLQMSANDLNQLSFEREKELIAANLKSLGAELNVFDLQYTTSGLEGDTWRFWSQTIIGNDTSIPNLKDAFPVQLPPGCVFRYVIEQNQFTESIYTKHLYKIDENLWKQLDLASRSILVLHEILYSQFIEEGQNNSKGVALLNGILFSKEIKSMTFSKYLSLLQESGRKHYAYGVMQPFDGRRLDQAILHLDLSQAHTFPFQLVRPRIDKKGNVGLPDVWKYWCKPDSISSEPDEGALQNTFFLRIAGDFAIAQTYERHHHFEEASPQSNIRADGLGATDPRNAGPEIYLYSEFSQKNVSDTAYVLHRKRHHRTLMNAVYEFPSTLLGGGILIAPQFAELSERSYEEISGFTVIFADKRFSCERVEKMIYWL